jgi:hypothetical protein
MNHLPPFFSLSSKGMSNFDSMYPAIFDKKDKGTVIHDNELSPGDDGNSHKKYPHSPHSPYSPIFMAGS